MKVSLEKETMENNLERVKKVVFLLLTTKGFFREIPMRFNCENKRIAFNSSSFGR